MKQPTTPKSLPHRWITFAAVISLWLPLAGTGCRSLSESNAASSASVTIQNQPPDKIALATIQVFTAEGYRPRVGESKQIMLFEKEASRATTLAREGLTDAYYGSVTIYRVKVEIHPLDAGAFRLQCKAFVVRGAGDSFFEEEVPLAQFRSGPYQSLLNKVEKQLTSTSGEAAPTAVPAATK
jgi:hypothetical protein